MRTTTPTDLPTDVPIDVPIACTLAPDAYVERVAWIADLNRDALRSHGQQDGALTLVYAPGAAARVRELVYREQACCAFLRFALEEASNGIRLTVAAPRHAQDTADMLLAPFLAGAPAPARNGAAEPSAALVGACSGPACGCGAAGGG